MAQNLAAQNPAAQNFTAQHLAVLTLLNHNVAGLTQAQFDALPPSGKLAYSSAMPYEFLMHHVPRNSTGLMSLLRTHNTNPNVLQEMVAAKIHKARRTKLPKRPLNSWMAYRSFYLGMFTNLQQKEASMYLTILWQQDPFKAKWTIIARAYSSIRDVVGRANAPLNAFLDVVTPQIGVLGINVYMKMMNWVFETDEAGLPTFKQSATPDLTQFPAYIMHTSMTEKDVVHFCARMGYITPVVARRVAGIDAAVTNATHANQRPQQSLLASAPVLPNALPGTITVKASSQHVSQNPDLGDKIPPGYAAAVSNRAHQVSAAQEIEYQWNGNMADLYHPSEGSIDLANAAGTVSLWDTTNINDANSMQNFIMISGVQDGFLPPFVPEDGAEEHRE